MSEAAEVSNHTYLDALAQSHRETAELVSDMHNFDDTVIKPLLGHQTLTSILDRSIEDLFVPYVDESKYIKKEVAWLTENLLVHLDPFNQAYVHLNLIRRNTCRLHLSRSKIMPVDEVHHVPQV